ncbi:MAG: hypothetical protein E6J84_04015 [Deltaproteobacteria bacterium]|nr:MAG: hypothetical protein E6J84_04015 [Deltaproteobacteria bacterium]
MPLADDYVGRGFFVSLKGTVWTRGTEDYGHNGVVKLLRDGTLIVALSDVPALRRDDVAQSRALGDLLEATLSSP